MEGGDDFFDRGFEVGLTDSYNGRSDALYRAPIRGPGPIYGRYKGDTMYQIPIHVLRQQPTSRPEITRKAEGLRARGRIMGVMLWDRSPGG